MKNEFRLITAVVIALALVSSAVAEAAPSRPMDEDAALALLVRTLKQDHILHASNFMGLYFLHHRREDERVLSVRSP